MANVLMLLSNAFRPDPRVEREATSLDAAGHQVTVIAWDRQAEFDRQENWKGVDIRRVQSVRSGYGSGWRQLFYTPRFWSAAVRRGLALRPDVVHCHDLDTLYAGVWLKRRLGCKLVYDAHEDYPALMSLYLPAPLVSALSWFERSLLREVDLTITASSVFADKLQKQGVRPVITIGNYASLEQHDRLSLDQVELARRELGIPPETLTIAYIGGFTRNRELAPLLEAAGGLPSVQFLLWGDGHQRATVEKAASEHPNVRYLGWLPAELVPLYTRMADAIYYCLRSDYPGAVYNAPNTLSNAMAAGTPVIANEVGDLGRIVKETGCGLLIPELTPAGIRRAVETLRDPNLRNRMGAAGRKASEEKYNWTRAGENLNRAYAELI